MINLEVLFLWNTIKGQLRHSLMRSPRFILDIIDNLGLLCFTNLKYVLYTIPSSLPKQQQKFKRFLYKMTFYLL